MKRIGTFNSQHWGKTIVLLGNYGSPKGPAAVALTLDDGEPLATLSVNMYRPDCSRDSADLPADCFYVKHWGGNESIVVDALASGLFKERADLPEARSGYVSAPVWQLVGSAS